MTRDEFIKSLEQTYSKGIEIVRKKNEDYAHSDNPFKNFESAEIVGLKPDRAILVRVLDKLSRISNLLEKPASVIDESVEDTIVDAINYLAILKAYLDDKKGNRTN